MPTTISNEEIQAIYRRGEEAVIMLTQSLVTRLNLLEEQVKALTAQKHKDSHNSSKPPASDPFRRVSKRVKSSSKKKSGGQVGHSGETLRQTDTPDVVITHSPTGPCSCSRSIESGTCIETRRRQVIDLPASVRMEVTEHQAQTFLCACGMVHEASFPDGINAAVQYGKRTRAAVTYLSSYQLIPQKRTTALMQDFFGVSLSEGTVNQVLQQAYDRLAPTEALIKSRIGSAAVAGADETGMYINGKRLWEHVVSTAQYTYYFCHERRGKQALREDGILEQFLGRLMHDGWVSYFDFSCLHALCNAHHLRELAFVHEEHGQKWAATMIKLLCHIKRVVDRAREAGRDQLAAQSIRKYRQCYEKIIAAGYRANPLPVQQSEVKRGRKKQSTARNLLDRLNKHADETLAFMYDFRVPFDNNRSERDLRMTKVKQKISGCFRSVAGAKIFCRIRSYISTVQKHGLDVFEKLAECFDPSVVKPSLL